MLTLVDKTSRNNVSYGSKKDQETIEWMNKCINESSIWCEPEHKRCEENERYAAGFQWNEGDALRQEARERPALPINKIRKILDAAANREIMDRFVPKAYGRDNADAGVAEVLDELGRWQRDMSETDHHESASFRKNCMSGLGVMHKWWDEAALDGQGLVRDEEMPIWMMLWDPRTRESNMSDRKYQICGKYIPIKELKQAYGHKLLGKKKMASVLDSWAMGGRGTESGGVTASGTRWGWRDIVSGDRWYIRAQAEAFVVEFEWVERKQAWKVAVPDRLGEWSGWLSGSPDGEIEYGTTVNQETGEPEPMTITVAAYSQLDEEQKRQIAYAVLYDTTMEVFDDKKVIDAINEIYNAAVGSDVLMSQSHKYVTRFAIITRNMILEEGIRPFGFTYEFMTGVPFEQRDGMRWRGMVDFAKGPQDMTNVFMSNMLSIYMNSGKNSLMMEEGLVADQNSLQNDYAKIGGIFFVPDGVVQQWDSRVKEVVGRDAPPMLRELIMLMDDAVENMFGLSSIEMGSQGNLSRISTGVAGQARQASNTMLAIWFDSLRKYRRRFGMLNLKMLQAAYTPKEMARIVGSEVATGLTGMEEWPNINRFDVKIDEAPTSVTEQIEQSNMMISSGTWEKLWSGGEMAKEDLIDMLYSWPKSQREKIKKNMNSMKQMQDQMQQVQKMAEDERKKNELLLDFLLHVDRGGVIKQQFETVFGMAQQMASQLIEQQQQPQEGQ